ncbi:hypothetical protein M3Y97_00048700 [Aphelenchoides bicaudatus]|nr:hypothetical protein M3Y97_00048700 [Aphelenchoides bicaudatus]
MMFRLVCLLAFVALARSLPLESHVDSDVESQLGSKCSFPNGTDKAFYAYNCDTTLPIQILSQNVYDNDTGKPMYPVDVKRKILIQLDAQNNGKVYADNKVDVDLAEYAYSWLKGECKWSNIPTLGLLDNIDGCDVAHNCPLEKGALKLLLPLDLTEYSTIIKILAGDKPYQLTIKMYDGSHKNQIACVVAQLKFAT